MRHAAIFLVLALVLASFQSARALEDEVTLFDKNGKAVAYIALDDETTIYLWTGEPVAYLKEVQGKYSIYGFNGKHLGWFVDGLVRDHSGYVVGFVESAGNFATEFEPFKSFRQFKPFKSFREFQPFYPFEQNVWSRLDLRILLSMGGK